MSLFNCWISISHRKSAPQIVLFFLETEQIHNFSHPWEANWFCCCSWRQRLTQFVFCEWHFWLFWSQSARLRFSTTTTRGPQGERCFCNIYRPDWKRHWEIQGWLLQHQNPSLKCVPMVPLMRETWGLTNQFVLRKPTSCSFKAPSRFPQREKTLEEERGGERRTSWTRTCHFKPRFTLNQLKEKCISYLKEEINWKRKQKKVKWLVESTKQNQMVLNILTLSKLLLQMRWEGGHYWPFWGDRSHSVLLQNEEG